MLFLSNWCTCPMYKSFNIVNVFVRIHIMLVLDKRLSPTSLGIKILKETITSSPFLEVDTFVALLIT